MNRVAVNEIGFAVANDNEVHLGGGGESNEARSRPGGSYSGNGKREGEWKMNNKLTASLK